MTRSEELLEKFLADELTEEERQEFDALLKNSPEFAKQVEEYTQLLHLLQKDAEATKHAAEKSPVVKKTLKRVAALVVAGAGTSAITSSVVNTGNTSILGSIIAWLAGGIVTITVGTVLLWNVIFKPSEQPPQPELRIVSDTPTVIVVPPPVANAVDTAPDSPERTAEQESDGAATIGTEDKQTGSVEQQEVPTVKLFAFAPSVDTGSERRIQAYYRTQIAQAQQRADTAAYIQNTMKLLESYLLTQDYSSAKVLFQRLADLPLTDDQYALLSFYRAQIARSENNYALAAQYIDEALRIVKSPELRSKLLAERAFLAYFQRDTVTARKMAEQAMENLDSTQPLARQLQQLLRVLR